jgi:uncharacterized OsmC-like protein
MHRESRSREVSVRQDPLREEYKIAPHKASIIDGAIAKSGSVEDPFHGFVYPGSKDYGVEIQYGIHEAVGGYHDAPNPGDILSAALSACLDSTIRIIANRLHVHIVRLEVEVTAHIDVRGTLMVDRNVRVGFQKMQCKVDIEVAKGTDSKLVDKVLTAAERSCVTLQTLRNGVEIETDIVSQ